MYSEFHQLSSLGMSTPQFLVLKDADDEDVQEQNSKFKISLEGNTSQNRDGLEEIVLAPKKNPSPSIQEDEFEEREYFYPGHDRENKCDETSVSSTESVKVTCLLGLGGASTTEVANDDEGFRTPTSSDHKIPVITECPPAPKKTRPPWSSSMKRKVSSTGARRALHLDLSTEVESMFPPSIHDHDEEEEEDDESKIKKARTDDHGSSV